MSAPADSWRAYGTAGLMAFASLAMVSLLPFATPPRPHRPAGILFPPGFDDRTSMAAVVHADPGAKILDMRWHGRLVFVTYDAVSFPEALSQAGALHLFDAVAAGCHAAPPETPPKIPRASG